MGESLQGGDSWKVGRAAARSGRTGEPQMQSFLEGAFFVGMVLAPCVIAMFTGAE
jgi:hypothetical protein